MLVISSGILMPIDAIIRNSHFRHLVVNLLLLPTEWMFNLPAVRFSTSKDSVLLASNLFIAPVALLGAALVWSSIIVLTQYVVMRRAFDLGLASRTQFWKISFWSTAAMSSVIFILWWLLNNATLGGYQLSPHASVVFGIVSVLSLPSIPSSLLANAFLDSGFDTLHGYDDALVVSKILTAFGPVIWSLIFALIATRWRSHKKEVEVVVK